MAAIGLRKISNDQSTYKFLIFGKIPMVEGMNPVS